MSPNPDTTTIKLISTSHRRLLITAAIVTFFLVAMGGVVCVTDSSQGCPDWPWCYGRLLPPWQMDSVIEYTHRAMAVVTTLLILISAWVGWKKARSVRWVSLPPLIAIFFLIAVSIFGAMAVLVGLSRGLAALDLGSALITLGLMLAAATAAAIYSGNTNQMIRFSLRSPLAKQVFWTLLAVFVMLVSAVLVAESGTIERCVGWPLFSMDLISVGALGGLQIARRVLAAAAVLMVLALVIQVWRLKETKKSIRTVTAVVAVCLVIELLVGWLMIAFGFSLFMLVVYVLMATAIWSTLVILLVLTALGPTGIDP